MNVAIPQHHGLLHLSLHMTAEGVETPGQLAALRRMHCDHAQGYLFARPMHPSDVPGYLHSDLPSLMQIAV